MRTSLSFVATLVAVAFLSAGCAGPERKLGRGISNVAEITRLGEVRRSMEQTGIWDGPDAAYTTGLVRGINRSLVRTATGMYEILTFPFPEYDPIFLPEHPVHPDSYRPRILSDPIWGPDAFLGFSGGDIAPMLPGSRFRIFDY